MSVKIKIPASELIGLKHDPLCLELAGRCSRCDHSPANFYEVNRLNFRVGEKPYRIAGKKYQISQEYRLKIAICETCYQSDFLTHPDLLDRNGSWLSRIARFHSIIWSVGGFLAAIGFLFLTPFIPDSAFFKPIKEMWQIPVLMGVLILFLNWLSQRKYQNQVLHTLEKSSSDFRSHPRAEVKTYSLENTQDLSRIALDITFNKEPWAIEVAEKRHWAFEKIPTGEPKIKSIE